MCVCVLSNAGLEPAGTLVPGSNPKEDDGPVQTPTERLHFMALGTGEWVNDAVSTELISREWCLHAGCEQVLCGYM